MNLARHSTSGGLLEISSTVPLGNILFTYGYNSVIPGRPYRQLLEQPYPPAGVASAAYPYLVINQSINQSLNKLSTNQSINNTIKYDKSKCNLKGRDETG